MRINSCISSFTGMLSTLSNLPVSAEQTYATINMREQFLERGQ